MKITKFLSALFFLGSCASGCGSSKATDGYNTAPRPIKSTPGTAAFLSATRGTRSLISPKRQFVNYIASAKRLTVIDQASESEAYSIQYPGTVLTAFPIANQWPHK